MMIRMQKPHLQLGFVQPSGLDLHQEFIQLVTGFGDVAADDLSIEGAFPVNDAPLWISSLFADCHI